MAANAMLLLAAVLSIGTWRSSIRAIYFNILGMKFGNELLIAFIPSIILASLSVMIAIVVWGTDLCVSLCSYVAIPMRDRLYELAKISRKVFYFLSRLLVTICSLAVMASVAVFLGNDLTKATGSSSVGNTTSLNSFALQLGVVAAVVQVLVFLGRERLFRSEKAEAARWKRNLQSVIANGVVVLALFAMVHAMARENISAYTTHRDPSLVRGEVADWSFLFHLFQDFKTKNEAYSPCMSQFTLDSLDLDAHAWQSYVGVSTASRNWRYSLRSFETADPPSIFEKEDYTREFQPINQSDWRKRLVFLCIGTKA